MADFDLKDKLVLICNDDGVFAPGIQSLARKLRSKGLDVWVIAPSSERSASSMSISIGSPLRYHKVEDKIYAVHGSPVDSIFMALGQILPRQPDWVLSGINRGGNLGQDTLYSGTVAAAMEGALRGIPSMALSLEPLFGQPLDYNNQLLFEDAAEVSWMIFEKYLSWGFEPGTVLNVNIPSLHLNEIRGFKKAALGRRLYETFMHPKMDPRGNPYFWIGAGGAFVEKEQTDCSLVHSGYVTMTALRPTYFQEDGKVAENQLDDLSQLLPMSNEPISEKGREVRS